MHIYHGLTRNVPHLSFPGHPWMWLGHALYAAALMAAARQQPRGEKS